MENASPAQHASGTGIALVALDSLREVVVVEDHGIDIPFPANKPPA